MVLDVFLACAVAAIVVAALGLAGWRLRQGRRHAARLAARAAAAGAGEADAQRLLRLSAQELRGIGVRLRGFAECDPAAHAAGLTAAAAQVLDIADALQDRAVPGARPRLLREEPVDLVAELHAAVAQAQLLLAPGHRHWRLPPAGVPHLLWADRRALRHVLGRVLADAVRNTGQQDWIEIALRPHPSGLALVVEDEGAGLGAPPGAPPAGPADSRGIGLRLALARSLMEAHGGLLEAEAMPRVGTRVSLVFPAARRREATCASPALEAAP